MTLEKEIYRKLAKKGWKHKVLTTGTYVAPIDGKYFLSGVAGGASGRVGSDTVERPGGGSGESVTDLGVNLKAGQVIPVSVASGGTGDGTEGGNTIFGDYLFLKGGGTSSGANYLGGGRVTADGSIRDPQFIDFNSSYKKPGANSTRGGTAAEKSILADFPDGAKAGVYMYGGAGSKYAPGGAGNASGAGSAGGIGAGGGSGTTAAGPGGDGYLEISWQE